MIWGIGDTVCGNSEIRRRMGYGGRGRELMVL